MTSLKRRFFSDGGLRRLASIASFRGPTYVHFNAGVTPTGFAELGAIIRPRLFWVMLMIFCLAVIGLEASSSVSFLVFVKSPPLTTASAQPTVPSTKAV